MKEGEEDKKGGGRKMKAAEMMKKSPHRPLNHPTDMKSLLALF